MVHDYLEGNIVRDISNGQEMKITTVRKGLFNDEPSGYVVCEWEEDGVAQKREFHVDNIEFMLEGDAKPYDIDKQGSCESSSKRGLFTLILFLIVRINSMAYDFTVGGLDYDINDDQNTVSVMNYYGASYTSVTHVNIPSHVDYKGKTYTVTRLTGCTFEDCAKLVSVILPNSVVSIDSYTFSGCTSLSEVVLSENLKNIGPFAFENCKSLCSITLPNSIEKVGTFIFKNCSSLSEVNIPHKLTTIERGMFSGCTNLTEIEIPQNIKTIGTQVFENSSIISLTIPYGVTEIGDLENCKLLKKIELPNSIISIGGFDGCTSLSSVQLPDSLLKLPSFKNCTGLRKIRVPDNITNIPNSNFSGCSGLKKIIIGNKVETIGSQAFLNCNNIDSIFVFGNSPSKSSAFETTVYNRTVLCVPFNSIDLYKSANVWKDFNNIQELKFKLTFTVDGIKHSEDSVAFGAPIVYPEIEKKEDHEFIWENTLDEMPTNDLVINGHYKKNTFYLTYVIDGVEYKKEKVVIGTPLNLIDNPTKEGHTFSGWSEIPSTMPEKDVTIIGSFIKNTYKLTYMVDGMVYMSSYVTYGDAIFPMAPPTKEGYIFSGWSEIPATMPASDVVVTGSFEVDGIENITNDMVVDVYNLQGIKVKEQVLFKDLESILPKGMYIVNGNKVAVE